MQNDYKELWCLVNWSNMGHLGEHDAYYSHYVQPLQQGQKTHASAGEIKLARFKSLRNASLCTGAMLKPVRQETQAETRNMIKI